MRNEDFDEFAQLLDDAYDLIGSGANKLISAGAKTMFFRALAQYPLPVVRSAIAAHCLDKDHGNFVPRPADIIRQIDLAQNNDRRPGAEEAWATALLSQDEGATVVWTSETAAAFSICRPVLESSGAISARKAFIEAYERLVGEARRAGVKPSWSASLGWDKERQTPALQRAESAGLLPSTHVSALLPPPANAEATADTAAREQLAKIKQMLADSEKAKQLRLEREAQERLGAEMAIDCQISARVAQYTAGRANH